MKGVGYATDREAIRAFRSELEAAGFVVQPGDPKASEERSEYPLEFTVDLVLPPAKKKSAASRAKSTTEPEETTDAAA